MEKTNKELFEQYWNSLSGETRSIMDKTSAYWGWLHGVKEKSNQLYERYEFEISALREKIDELVEGYNHYKGIDNEAYGGYREDQ